MPSDSDGLRVRILQTTDGAEPTMYEAALIYGRSGVLEVSGPRCRKDSALYFLLEILRRGGREIPRKAEALRLVEAAYQAEKDTAALASL